MFDTKSLLYELEQYEQWVLWEIEGGKKIPVNPTTGKTANPTDPATWASYEITRAAFEEHGYEGVGFVFTEDDPLCGIDLDNCIDPDTGELEERASQIVDDLDTYTEVSPSGTGLHLFIRGTKPGTACRKNNMEIYDNAHYIAVTGNVLRDQPVQDRQQELDSLYEHVFGDASPDVASHSGIREGEGGDEHSSGGEILTDQELLSKARASKTGGRFTRLYDHGDTSNYPSASEADQALAGYLAFWTCRDAERIESLMWRSQLVREKWTENRDYIPRTIARAIENCTAVYQPKAYREQAKSTVNGKLTYLAQWRMEYAWTGRGGATDRDVYYALLSIAERYGRDHKDGVTVSASIRDLALEAGIGSLNTVRNSLNRLRDKHSGVRLLKSGSAREASTYLLACDSRADPKLIHIYCVDKYVSPLGQMVRNPNRIVSTIGKRNKQILDFVLLQDRPVTLDEIAEHLGIRKNHLKSRNIPTLLAEPAFLIETNEGYITPEDIAERLEEHMESSGQNRAYRVQHEKNEEQRKHFHNKEVSLKEAQRMADAENRERNRVHRTARNEGQISDTASLTSVTESSEKRGG